MRDPFFRQILIAIIALTFGLFTMTLLNLSLGEGRFSVYIELYLFSIIWALLLIFILKKKNITF